MSELREIRYVEWVDSARARAVWIDDDDEIVVLSCHSVGFVRAETDDVLELAGDWNASQHGRVFVIPKVAILKSRTLRRPR